MIEDYSDQEEVADSMATEIVSLSREFGKVIGKFVTKREQTDLLAIPVIAMAMGVCLARVADAANHSMKKTDQRQQLMKILNTYMKEAPDSVTYGKPGN